ncbi:hypothetical protein N7470_007462 [Penicillium chermesinum]|nr:hypothetical protein N7470_007462 [Penicillium chermesinum]
MAYSPYFASITSESAFKTRFKAENRQVFENLRNAAASHWDRGHLFACRVVRREPQRNILPVLSRYTTPTDIDSASDEIKLFLKGPDMGSMAQSEHSLIRGSNYSISLAQIWAAMAMFKGSPDRRTQNITKDDDIVEEDSIIPADELETRHPKRARRFTNQPGFVESGSIQVDSSSPLAEGSSHSSSPQESSLGYVDSDLHILAVSPEDDTMRLASCVIRHILYFGAPQHSNWNPKVVEFRDAKIRLDAITTRRERHIIAIDDGGLCLRKHEPTKGFVLVNNHIAVLEAKTRFQCLQNGRPIISDECFAQMTCEALATKLSSPSFPQR